MGPWWCPRNTAHCIRSLGRCGIKKKKNVWREANPEEGAADVTAGVEHPAEALRVRLQAVCARHRRHREREERPLLQHRLNWLRRPRRRLGCLHTHTLGFSLISPHPVVLTCPGSHNRRRLLAARADETRFTVPDW